MNNFELLENIKESIKNKYGLVDVKLLEKENIQLLIHENMPKDSAYVVAEFCCIKLQECFNRQFKIKHCMSHDKCKSKDIFYIYFFE